MKTKKYQTSLEFKDEKLMQQPPNFPDLKTNKKFLSGNIRRKIHVKGKQFTQEQEVLKIKVTVSMSFDTATVNCLLNLRMSTPKDCTLKMTHK